MRLKVLASLFVLGLLLTGTGLSQDIDSFSYLFPRFTSTPESAIKIVNLGTGIAEAEVEFFSSDGLVGGLFLTILPATQQTITAAEIGATSVGAVRVQSSASLEVTAVLAEEGGSLEVAEPVAPGSNLIIPFAHGTQGTTSLDIFNLGVSPARLFITAYDPAGLSLGFADEMVDSGAGIHTTLNDLLGDAVVGPPNNVSHVTIRVLSNVFQPAGDIVASALVTGFSDIGNGVGLRTDPAWIPASSDRLEPTATDVPLLVEGAGLFTILQVVNASDSVQTVSLRAIGQDGLNLASVVERVLGPNGAIRDRASEIFGLDEESFSMGSVRIEGTEPVTAVSVIGHTTGTSLIVVPDSTLHATELVWSTREEDRNFYDGITLLNRETTAASVLLSFIRADRTTVSSTSLTIPASEQLTRTLAELLPEVLEEGIVVVQSDIPIMGSALTGTGAILLNNLPVQFVAGGANVPAQADFLAVGTVRFSGAALPRVNVHLTGAVSESKVTDGVGTFTFRPVLPGIYTLTPQLIGYAFSPASIPIAITDSNSRNNDFEGTLIQPEISSITPPSVVSNSPETTLTITGGPFIATSQAIFDGLPLVTTLVDSETLTATIDAVDLTLPREGTLVIRNTGPGGASVSSDPEQVSVGSPAPVISALVGVPDEVVTGDASFTITVDGLNFVEGTVVQVDDMARMTTFVDENTLTATIPATDLTVAGFLSVTAIKPSPTIGPSNEIIITVLNPLAGLTSVTPDVFVARPEEDPEPVPLTVIGSDFVEGAVVLLDGEEIPATFASSNILFAQIPGELIPDGGPKRIHVSNPAPVVLREPPSETLPVMILNPVPVLTSLNVTRGVFDEDRPVRPDGEAQTFNMIVVLNGENFNESSKAFYGGGCETFEGSGDRLDSRQMVFEIPVTCATHFFVLVENAQPGGGVSEVLSFSTDPDDSVEGSPPPILTGLAGVPDELVTGSSDLTITVNGTDIVEGTIVQVGGMPRATMFVDDRTLTVTIPATDLAVAGTLEITAIKPSPTVAPSNGLLITVLNPVAGLTSVTPATFVAQPGEGSEPPTLTVVGSRFVEGTVVLLDGTALPTTYLGSTSLSAQIPTELIPDGGPRRITVSNPAPVVVREATSETLSVMILNPVPVLESLSVTPAVFDEDRSTRPDGTPQAFQIIVVLNGANFNGSTNAFFRGGCEDFTGSGTLVDSTQMIFDIPVTCATHWFVLVENSQPGGGVSDTLAFTSDPDDTVDGSPPPTLTGLVGVPDELVTGSSDLTITVNGLDFVEGTVVQVNQLVRTTTVVDENTLIATIPATDLTVAGILEITAIKPAPTIGPSNELLITVLNPIAGLTSVTPDTFVARPGENPDPVTLTVAGSRFVEGAVVLFDGTELPTTFTDSTTLVAEIPGELIPDGGPRTITVSNPEPVVLRIPSSETVPVMITNPVPVLDSLSVTRGIFDEDRPTRPDGTGQTFEIIVVLNGSNFNLSTSAFFGGGCETFEGSGDLLNSTQMVFTIPVTCATHWFVLVENAQPGGGESQILAFSSDPDDSVDGSSPPILTELIGVPDELLTGTGDLTITVKGTDFVAGTDVQVNGVTRSTTFVDENTLLVTIPSTDTAVAGTLVITATKPAPTIAPSNALLITVLNPVAGLLSVTPDRFVARPGENPQPVTLMVSGFNFVDGSVALLDGTALTTTVIDSTTLIAVVPGELIPDGGGRRLTVSNPAPVVLRDPPSETLPLTVLNPIPVLESVVVGPAVFDDPRAVDLGGDDAGFSVIVVLTGANFNSSTIAFFSGGCESFEVTGSLLNSRQFVFDIPVTCSATYTVIVENVQPGGGVSDIRSFTIALGPETILEPTITGIDPETVTAGGPTFDLTISGSDFAPGDLDDPGSLVVLGTAVLTPTSTTATEIVVSVPELLIGAPGILPIIVTSPDAGDSNRRFLVIENP